MQLFESLNKDMTLLSQENCMYTFSLNTSVRVFFLAFSFSILIQDRHRSDTFTGNYNTALTFYLTVLKIGVNWQLSLYAF